MAENLENSKQQDLDEKQAFGETHEYDGINELNNPAPAWIIIVFIVTIGFSLVYAIYNFGFPDNGRDQVSIYERKVAEAKAELAQKKAEVSTEAVELSLDEIIAAGNKLYTEQGCLACHGANGEGNAIGPNLTDNNWIHGCSEEEIAKVIKEGVLAKGMTAFGAQMSDDQISSVTKFILNKLVGSEPANAKAPDGEECK